MPSGIAMAAPSSTAQDASSRVLPIRRVGAEGAAEVAAHGARQPVEVAHRQRVVEAEFRAPLRDRLGRDRLDPLGAQQELGRVAGRDRLQAEADQRDHEQHRQRGQQATEQVASHAVRLNARVSRRQ
jgi:hypothetical protein